MTRPDMVLWLSDARGVYIPRDFATCFIDRDKHVQGVSDEYWAILEAGPDHEWYWETWDEILNEATVADEHGVIYTLHQDGDLWLVPEGMEWNEHMETFEWPKEEYGDDRDMTAPYEP